MSAFLLAILTFIFVGFKRQTDKTNYLSRDITISVSGIFALIIFCSHFFGYIDYSSLNFIDKPLYYFVSLLGQLMVSPFLFFSGYGVFESFKKKGVEYANSMPKNRLLKLFLSFFVAWIFFASTALYFKSNYSIVDYCFSVFGIKTIGNSNWYVVVIFLLYFISFISFSFSNSKKSSLLIHLIFFPVVYILLHKISPGEWWYNTLVCYFFGILYSFFKEKIDSRLAKNKINGILFFVISFFCFATFYALHRMIDILVLRELLYAIVNLFFCLSIVSFLYLFRVRNKVLFFIGANCFWIYILQRLSMIIFSHSSFISNNIYIYFIVCFAFTILLAFVCNKSFSYIWNIVILRKGRVGETTNTRVGIVLSYVTLALSILGAFIVTPRLLEMLGDVQYGLRSFAMSIAAWLTVVSSALSASYLRFVNQSKKDSGSGEGIINKLYLKIFIFISLLVLTVTIIATTVCYCVNVSFGNYSDEENKLIIVLLFISGINVAVQIASSVFTNYLTYKKEFIFIRGLTLIISFFTFALELIFVFLTKSVIAVSAVALALTVVSFISSLIFAIKVKGMAFTCKSDSKNNILLKSIIVFSSFVLLNAIVDQINHYVDITILGFMTNAENVTIYTLSKYFVTYLVSLSVAISSTYAPKVHEYVNNGDMASINQLFSRVSRIQLIILLFVVGGFASSGHSFIRIWLGDEKEYIYYYSLVLLSLNIVPMSCNLGIEVQRAMNKHKFRAILYLLIAMLNVAISILLIAILPSHMAVWAAIFGTVFSVVVGNTIILNLYNHFAIGLNMKKYLFTLLKYLTITAVAISPSLVISIFFNGFYSNAASFLINGFSFVLLFVIELLIIDRKTTIPFVKTMLKKIK